RRRRPDPARLRRQEPESRRRQRHAHGSRRQHVPAYLRPGREGRGDHQARHLNQSNDRGLEKNCRCFLSLVCFP
ncbi:hypothetical protein CH063_09940, partial [Colletotrichum higginsianum]